MKSRRSKVSSCDQRLAFAAVGAAEVGSLTFGKGGRVLGLVVIEVAADIAIEVETLAARGEHWGLPYLQSLLGYCEKCWM